MARTSVLISGASVAGPALGYWLSKAGWDVTIVEQAPRLREGGYAVDFRGHIHLDLLERMGVLAQLQARDTGGSAMRFVDVDGRTRLHLPTDFAGGDLEIRRADLSRVLCDSSNGNIEFIFGDAIKSLDDVGAAVEITFENAPPRRFDFLVGADGIHSHTRHLAFGKSAKFEHYLGYFIATWDAPGVEGAFDETTLFNVPGRVAAITPPGRDGLPFGAMCLFASPELSYRRDDTAFQVNVVKRAFAGVGWRVPELLSALDPACEIFFGPLTRADVPNWSKGRVVLLGDAAWGATLGGMGTGAAIVGAYVLAGELSSSPEDHAAAFSRYQQRLEAYVRKCQEGGNRTGSFLAPRTRHGLAFRNRLMNWAPARNWMIREGRKITSNIALPPYRSLE